MKVRPFLIVFLYLFSAYAHDKKLNTVINTAMEKKDGTCVFIECNTGKLTTSDSVIASTRFTPCSTFKIWNTLIGVESQFINSSDALFYIWDSIPRLYPAWNKDQNLKDAFQVSCVPAFQILARKIGRTTMKKWIDTLQYGDRDISSGIDDFWLPQEDKKAISITPIRQAQLIRELVNGELPFSEQSRTILKDVMLVTTSSKGSLYGKTGSGVTVPDKQGIGWFVGYCTNGTSTWSFACLLRGEKVSGNDAKDTVKSILKRSELL